MLNFEIDLERVTSPVVDFLSKLLPQLPILLVIILVGILVVKIASLMIKRVLNASNLPLGLIEIISPFVDFALWALLTVLILHLMGLSNLILALGGSLAVIAISLSRGVTSTTSDLFAGIHLARDKDFGVGTKVRIRVSDKRIIEGEVVEMDTKKTRIKDADGYLHVLPNSLIDHNEWIMLERHQPKTKKGGIIKSTLILKSRKSGKKSL